MTKLRSTVLLFMLAAGGLTEVAAAQAARRFVVARTAAKTTIEGSAMIASSQDLMFVISGSTTSALGSSLASNTSKTPPAQTLASRSTNPIMQLNGAVSRAVPVSARASFLVAGDAGQSISVIVPSEVGLTRTGGAETARLRTDTDIVDGPQFLGGTFDDNGSLSFDVGGQVTLASADVAAGTYSGVLAVVAQYN